jgi:hypothetical protein
MHRFRTHELVLGALLMLAAVAVALTINAVTPANGWSWGLFGQIFAALLNLGLSDYSNLGQAVTAVIAAIAALLAIWQVRVQRELARKRNAFDFFFKTEMEEDMLTAYRNSRNAFKDLRLGNPVKPFIGTPPYLVRKYLNIHELMSVGIHKDVLDDEVCYGYWADELIRDFESARALIAHIRELPHEGTQHTYSDMEKTYERWRDQRADAVHRA